MSVRDTLEARGYPTRLIANPVTDPVRFSWTLDNGNSASSVASGGSRRWTRITLRACWYGVRRGSTWARLAACRPGVCPLKRRRLFSLGCGAFGALWSIVASRRSGTGRGLTSCPGKASRALRASGAGHVGDERRGGSAPVRPTASGGRCGGRRLWRGHMTLGTSLRVTTTGAAWLRFSDHPGPARSPARRSGARLRRRRARDLGP